MHWMCSFWKKYGKVFIPTHAIWKLPKLLPLPSCKIFKTITVVNFSKLPLMTSCKVFKTSTSYMETFQNTILPKLSLPCMTECMHCQSCTKTNRDALFVWRSALLANSGILRCEPAEHVLPIIRRSRRYAQLAGRLANPRRYSLIVFNVL
jgi:hypothetical protein